MASAATAATSVDTAPPCGGVARTTALSRPARQPVLLCGLGQLIQYTPVALTAICQGRVDTVARIVGGAPFRGNAATAPPRAR